MKSLGFIFLFLLQTVKPDPIPGVPAETGIYYRQGEAWNRLQPASMADMKAKGVDLFLETDGLTGLDLTIHYQGAQATAQVQVRKPAFYVRGVGAANAAMIVQLSSKKDSRTIQTSSLDATLDNRGGFKKDAIRNVTVTVYSDDSFSVTPEQNLRPGEYLLVFGHANTGFDFGVAPQLNRKWRNPEGHFIPHGRSTALREDLFHPADGTIHQTHLDSMWMSGRVCKDVFDGTLGQIP